MAEGNLRGNEGGQEGTFAAIKTSHFACGHDMRCNKFKTAHRFQNQISYMKDLFLLLLTLFLALKSNAQFAPPVALSDALTSRLAIADFNQDGYDDIASVGFNTTTDIDELFWLEGQGDGSFAPPQTINEQMSMGLGITAGDLDGDGVPELLSGIYNQFDFLMVVYKYNATDGFVPSDTLTYNGYSRFWDVEIFDLDLDGDNDIVYLEQGVNTSLTGWVGWFKNLGGGDFNDGEIIMSGVNKGSEIAIGPHIFDDDDFPEIFIAKKSPNPVQAVDMNPSGTFDAPVTIGTGTTTEAVHINTSRYFDYFGILPANAVTGEIVVLRGTSGFSQIVQYQYDVAFPKLLVSTPLNLSSTALGDLNLDGLTDLVVGAVDGSLHLMLGNPDGDLGSLTEIPNSPAGCYRVYLNDVDYDGDLDILAACSRLPGPPAVDGVMLVRNLTRDKSMSGTVFWDENADGTWDPDEPGLPRFPIKVEPAASTVYAQPDGLYGVYATAGSYEVSPDLGDCWELTTTPATYDVDFDGYTNVEDLNFGVQSLGTEKVASVNLISSPTRCGFSVPFWLNLSNDGCTPISGRAFLVKSGLVTFQSAATNPSQVSGDTLFWDFANLVPSDNFQVEMNFVIADASFLGEVIHIPLGVQSIDNQGDLQILASYQFQSTINCAYDPNDKQVYPRRSEHPPFDANYTLFNERLEYTIRFQNTGTDTAFNVVIRDTLSTDLDLSTFRPGSASHPFETTLHDDGLLEFHFRQIMLPDSNVNEPGSHGYVNFSIQAKPDIAEGTNIDNHAGIYFDYNPPIVTNSVDNILVENLPDFTPAAAFDFILTDWTVQFNDLSTNTPTSWRWDFGDGSTSTEQHPEQTYATPGDYTVCLTAANDWGSNLACQNLMVLTSAEEAFGNTPFIYVYPNPTQDEIWIEKTTDQNIRVTLLGLMGQTMGVYVLSEKTTRINISELPEGVWLLRTTNGATAKVVKL